MKLEPGDIITFGKEHFVYIGFDMNAFQFYGIGDTRFRISKEDMFKLDGATVIGKTVCRVQCPNECTHNRWWLSREQAIERWNMTTKSSKP